MRLRSTVLRRLKVVVRVARIYNARLESREPLQDRLDQTSMVNCSIKGFSPGAPNVF